VEVLGEDPARAGSSWRERIGVVLQSSSMYAQLTVSEILGQFGGYYEAPRPVEEVVDLVGLREKRDARVATLSGGQKRRLDLGLALVGDPELVFLDEPTTGFDPEARLRAGDTVRSLRDLGKTVLLTTHYLDEAERLCDRVAVLLGGEIAALGRPGELTGALPPTEIRFRRDGEDVVVRTEEPTKVLHELTSEALHDGRELEGIEVRRPSLEDVYLSLTGNGS
jgi:ABC-2 type transport system ATP-binding protein